MEKDFDQWNEVKKSLESRLDVDKRYFFNEGEVWWCALGLNIGFEEDGKGIHFERPILIVKKFNQSIFLAVPLTTTLKKGSPYYFPITSPDEIMRSIIISQIRLIDIHRLTLKMFEIEVDVFQEVKKNLRQFFV